MESLPYELLQNISSYLLPKYQCRLALISKYNYQYLHNDLLKWHVKKSLITPPRYKCLYRCDDIYCHVSLTEFNKQIVLYEQVFIDNLHIHNLTHQWINTIDYNIKNNEHGRVVMDIREIIQICEMLQGTNILTGCYKYIHKIPLLVYLSSRHPLLSMPGEILDNIMDNLSDSDRETFIISSAYLNYIYN